ncbi:MAG: winged helix-turn-helix transcriptional regulator [Methanomicrobia archaeon]|nr:winged helix-turn-helix transcriptional regulator [Methanomicrobia archaeon]
MSASEETETEVAPHKKKRPVACSHGYSCNIPASYEIAPETLERVKEAITLDVGTPVAVFKALADPLRLRILKALRVSDLCVCVFVELLDCEYSRLSYHLKVLKDAGLVEYTQEGNFLIYHLTEFGRAVLGGVDAIKSLDCRR